MNKPTYTKASVIASLIDETNERAFVLALRKYYRDNFNNGKSTECFMNWVEMIVNSKPVKQASKQASS